MGRFAWVLVLIGVCAGAGCAYVSKTEFLEAWDHDEDGWPVGEDCNDDPDQNGGTVHPSVADVRGDGCDADCSRTPDADGDDWPDDADCNPNDASVFPCSDAEVPGDDVDSDCDGADEARLDTCLGWDPDYDTSEQVRFTAENCPCPAPAFGGCGIAE